MTAVVILETAKEHIRVRAHSKTFKNSATTNLNLCSENLPSAPKTRNKTETSTTFYIATGPDKLPESILLQYKSHFITRLPSPDPDTVLKTITCTFYTSLFNQKMKKYGLYDPYKT